MAYCTFCDKKAVRKGFNHWLGDYFACGKHTDDHPLIVNHTNRIKIELDDAEQEQEQAIEMAVCPVCGYEFIKKPNKVYCSKRCGAKKRRQDETTHIQEMIEEVNKEVENPHNNEMRWCCDRILGCIEEFRWDTSDRSKVEFYCVEALRYLGRIRNAH